MTKRTINFEEAKTTYGNGNGYGYGNGDGYGYGDGYGNGNGNGDGYGNGSLEYLVKFLVLVADKLVAKWVMKEPNQELKRIFIEAIGIDRFFSQLDAQVVHSDIDGCGNPRSLLRIPMTETTKGYLQAVRVVCPTTGRIYHLGVSPDVVTCQEAVASTFKLKPNNYHPERES